MIKLLLVIIIAICVKMIYDAREICEKYFSSSQKNRQVAILKITSFFIAIICAILLYILLYR